MADPKEVSLTDAEGGVADSSSSSSTSNKKKNSSSDATPTTSSGNKNKNDNGSSNYFSSERAPSENQSYGDMISEWFNTPGKVGTYMSYFLMLVGMIGSIIAQKCADKDIHESYWLDDCPAGYDKECKGNGAVYRFSFALFIIFALQVVGTTIDIRFYDALWVPKLLLFGGFVIWFYYTPGHVFDDNGYAWLARILAFFYVILQQIILIDFAYNWNDSWVNKAEEHGGNKWLIILLVTCFVLIGGSYSAIGVMFWQFGHCDSAEVILSLTVVLPTLALIYQVFFVEKRASLLTSAIMMAYATYVCYSALTLNPDKSCNPTIATKYQTLSTVIGMVILVLSMTYSTSNTCKIIMIIIMMFKYMY